MSETQRLVFGDYDDLVDPGAVDVDEQDVMNPDVDPAFVDLMDTHAANGTLHRVPDTAREVWERHE